MAIQWLYTRIFIDITLVGESTFINKIDCMVNILSSLIIIIIRLGFSKKKLSQKPLAVHKHRYSCQVSS